MSTIAGYLADIVYWVILVFLVRAIFSWILIFGVRNQFVLRANLTLSSITDPIIAPLRRYIPPIGGLDLSYMVAVLLLVLIREILLSI